MECFILFEHLSFTAFIEIISWSSLKHEQCDRNGAASLDEREQTGVLFSPV